jgi:hypothetical protein
MTPSVQQRRGVPNKPADPAADALTFFDLYQEF